MAPGPEERSQVVHITSKGQATIPASFREKFGIEAPGRVRFVAQKDRLVLQPVRSVDQMMGSLREHVPDDVSVVEELRREREREREADDRRANRR